MHIISEKQAEELLDIYGQGKVFQYEHRPSRLTLFGIELPSGRKITADPRAAAPRKTEGE
jgi:hypothetical protein